MSFSRVCRVARLHSRTGFFLVTLLCTFLLQPSVQAEDVRRVVTGRSPMTKSLGGGQSGELLLNTKVVVLEEKGAWSRVQAEGWVRTKTLSAPSADAASAPAPVERPKVLQGALRVTEFVRSRRDDVSPPREYVVLSVKNDSPRTIRSWSGLLVALDEKETAVFRERVSEEGINWKPRESRDVTFFWQPAEEGFADLQQVELGTHRMVLLDVEIK